MKYYTESERVDLPWTLGGQIYIKNDTMQQLTQLYPCYRNLPIRREHCLES